MVSRGQGDCVARRRLSCPVYARHSAGDTNEPEAAQTQSGVKLFTWVPLGVRGVIHARISPGVKKKVRPSGTFPGQGAVRRWVLPDAADGSRGVRCEANVSLRIRPGNQQHAAGRFFFGGGRCGQAGVIGKSGTAGRRDP